MRPCDLARIGQMLLQSGEMDGRQIVPRAWISRSMMSYVACDEVRRIGYHWYNGYFDFAVPFGPRWDRNRPEAFQGAYGNGGQRLWVLPGLELVVVGTADNYDTPDQWVPPTRVLREVVVARHECARRLCAGFV